MSVLSWYLHQDDKEDKDKKAKRLQFVIKNDTYLITINA